MTTTALDYALMGQLRRSAGDAVDSWAYKAKALLVGDALEEVKVRMGLRSFEGLFPAGVDLPGRIARLAFQSVGSDDAGSVCVAIGVYVYYLALIGRIEAEAFDGVFADAWAVYFRCVGGWMAEGVEAMTGR